MDFFWFIYAIVLFEALDIASAATRLELYKELKYLSIDATKELPINIYSSACFYLIPDDSIIKMTKIFPITYLFDRFLKRMLKDKNYNGVNVLKQLDNIKNIKWDEIKYKKLKYNT